ncbi:hypothetical protein [Marinobacter xestospongiae]|uniref:DUF3828 domain-containing protein n=1 Tax=Marinobacter xestospongiae TaxID=994319 RepID=A0ABU3VXC0_9GAMM|nr:hypothetical protein [Marinobacter xestospongiae]MDV2078919.1 hypothetical protein [Marinobacter xestospongiae]
MKIHMALQKVSGICFAAPFKILSLLLMFIGGCASHGDYVYLYDVYKEYAYRLQERDYGYIMEDALSSSMSNRGLEDPKEFSDYYPVLSDLPDILVKKTAHYELRDGGFGCLTLNGFDRFDRPAVIKMEFKREQERWKLDYVSVDYLDSPAGFIEAAVCPKRRA